jgi:hypothetical protein
MLFYGTFTSSGTFVQNQIFHFCFLTLICNIVTYFLWDGSESKSQSSNTLFAVKVMDFFLECGFLLRVFTLFAVKVMDFFLECSELEFAKVHQLASPTCLYVCLSTCTNLRNAEWIYMFSNDWRIYLYSDAIILLQKCKMIVTEHNY